MQLIRILDGQGSQNEPVDHAENGGIRSDAKSESEYDDQKNTGLLRKCRNE